MLLVSTDGKVGRKFEGGINLDGTVNIIPYIVMVEDRPARSAGITKKSGVKIKTLTKRMPRNVRRTRGVS